MSKIMTGRWSGYYGENSVKISISVYDPKWLKPDGKVKELAPYGILKLEGKAFDTAYRSQLEVLGIQRIAIIFKSLASQFPDKDIILCCYENVWAGEFCHRRDLADFILEMTGKELKEAPELPKPKKEKPAQMSMFEDYEIL